MTQCQIQMGNKVVVREQRKTSSVACVIAAKVIFLMFLALGGVAYNWRYYTETANYQNYRQGDQISMRAIGAADFSTNMCQRYTVQPSTPANVYLLRDLAQSGPDDETTERTQLTDGPFITDEGYKYDALYLLEHSMITIEGCKNLNQYSVMSIEMDVMIFKGHHSWIEWKNDPSCEDCQISRLRLTETDLCRDGWKSMFYRVPDDDHYHVAVAPRYKKDYHKQVDVDVVLTIKRRRYNLNHQLEHCEHTMGCKLDLEFSSDQDIVVEFLDQGGALPKIEFTTTCRLRAVMWASVFGIAPMVFIVLVLTCFCCYRSYNCGRNKGYSKMEKESKTINELPIAYGSMDAKSKMNTI